MKAPIAIFGFNRPGHFRAMVESLKSNKSWNEREIYVFVDGARNADEEEKVREVVSIARGLTGHVAVSETNKGLAQSIIGGVTEVIDRHGRAIVLEDDLVLLPRFLEFMDQALDVYQSDERIMSVCGYGLKIERPKGYEGDVYLSRRSSSWGWATWADRWHTIDWNVSDWASLRSDRARQRAFNRGGSDMYSMLRDYMEGRNRSWAIRFCYSQFLQNRWSVHPFRTLVLNEGFGADATNCKQTYSRFKTVPEDRIEGEYRMPVDIESHPDILKENAHYHGFGLRLYSRIRKILRI